MWHFVIGVAFGISYVREHWWFLAAIVLCLVGDEISKRVGG